MKRKRRPERRVPSPAAIAAVLAIALIGAAAVVAAAAGGWLGKALRRSDTRVFLAVGIVAAVLAGLLLAAMFRLGRGRRERRRLGDESGTAAIEMILVLPFALSLVLIMIQSMFLATGTVVIQYAAYAGARAAVTWVPEKLSYDEPRNVVVEGPGSDKLERIRSAAVEVVKAISPSARGAGGAPNTPEGQLLADGYDRFYAKSGEQSPGWVARMLPAKYDYANVAEYTEVTLAPPADGETYGDREDLTVTVRHALYLSVPYANLLFRDRNGEVELPSGTGYATEVEATYSLTNEGVEDEIDVEVFPRQVRPGEE